MQIFLHYFPKTVHKWSHSLPGKICILHIYCHSARERGREEAKENVLIIHRLFSSQSLLPSGIHKKNHWRPTIAVACQTKLLPHYCPGTEWGGYTEFIIKNEINKLWASSKNSGRQKTQFSGNNNTQLSCDDGANNTKTAWWPLKPIIYLGD